jgi:predicted Zn-dependent protease
LLILSRHFLQFFPLLFVSGFVALWSCSGAALAVAPLDYQTESRIFDSLGKAHDLIVADRYTEAKPLLESATKFDPSRYSGNLHESLAIVYRELGYPEKGVSQAKAAMKYGGSPGASYTMGLCYSDMGDFVEAEQWFQRFIIDSPDPVFKQQARDIIRDMQDDIHKVKAGVPKKRDYFDDITTNHEMQRWKQSMVPLKLYIAPGKGVKNYRPTYRRLIIEALDSWCSGSGNKLSYKLVPDKTNADIVVEWVDHPIATTQNDRKRDAAGLTTTLYDDKLEISHALVQIETYDFAHSKEAADSTIKSACLHEIGHAIGVGHSSYVKDIMYYKMTPRQLFSLSPRDRATAGKVYADYPVVTLVTGTYSLPAECFAQPSLPPGVMRYPPIPPSYFAQPPLPPQKHGDDPEPDVAENSSSSLFAQPSLPKSGHSGDSAAHRPSLPSHLFAQPALPPGNKNTSSAKSASNSKPPSNAKSASTAAGKKSTPAKTSSPSQLFATPSLPPKRP